MPRNLDRRVEAVVDVDDVDLQPRLQEILDVNLADDALAWCLEASGAWAQVDGPGAVDAHLLMQENATRRHHRNGAGAWQRGGAGKRGAGRVSLGGRGCIKK